MKHLDLLKFPIGKFEFNVDKESKEGILRIKNLPNELNSILENVTEKQLNWRYRPNGWTLCQVIHHISDSHMNAYIRMKIARTTSGALITPYDENAWSKFPDACSVDIVNSMKIIFSLHQKWVTFLNQLEENELENTYFHPGDNEHVSLRKAIQMYAWHGEHHCAHLKQGLESEGKY